MSYYFDQLRLHSGKGDVFHASLTNDPSADAVGAFSVDGTFLASREDLVRIANHLIKYLQDPDGMPKPKVVLEAVPEAEVEPVGPWIPDYDLDEVVESFDPVCP